MRWIPILCALLLATAGCVGDPTSEDNSSEDGTPQETDPDSRTVERTLTFEGEIEEPQAGGERLDESWGVRLDPGLVALEVDLAWTEQTNGFGLETELPDGDVHETQPPEDPTATEVEDEVPAVGGGSYTFHLTAADGPVLPDNVTLRAHATIELVDPPDGEQTPPVQTQEEGDEWRAEIRYHETGSVGENARVDVGTVNGGIEHDGSAGGGEATVIAWGRGDTEEQAAERARSIQVTVEVAEDGITARAEADDWEHRGASVDTGVPSSTTVDAELSTTNGGVDLVSTTASSLSAQTTNGAIEGDLTTRGPVETSTTNGEIAMDVSPTESLEIDASTTNGQIELGLLETSDIAYEIDASTTNGAISEQMEEAHLEGDDEHATLITDDGDGRPVQVTGSTSTTNGEIGFVGN